MTEANSVEEGVRYGRAGFHVFPAKIISANGKLVKKPLIKEWQRRATTDEAAIRELFGPHPDALVAWVPDLSGNFIADLDVKDGKDGYASLKAFEIANGELPETLTIGTPSGGEHRVFRGRVPNSVGDDGLDFRGGRGDGEGLGFGILPTPGSGYTVKIKAKAADGPAELIREAWRRGEPKTKKTERTGPKIAADLPHNVERYGRFLEAHRGIDKGKQNDGGARLCGIACNFAVSPDVGWPLFVEKIGSRCNPPITLDDRLADAGTWRETDDWGVWALERPGDPEMVAVLASYSGADAFAPFAPPPPPAGPVRITNAYSRAVPPVQELVRDVIEKGTVTFLAGPGGVHKSRLAQQVGLLIDAGMPVLGRTVERATFVHVFCEDHDDEVVRRGQTIRSRLNIPEDLQGWHWDASREPPLAVVTEDGRCEPAGFYKPLIDHLDAIDGHKFVVLDSTYDVLTFVGNAKINESGVKAAINLLQRICDEHDCTILILWHPSQAGQERGDASGWSVAWHNAPRARLSLSAVSDEPDTFVLKVEKRNHGPKGEQIKLRWDAGVLSLVDAADPVARHAEDKQRVLAMIEMRLTKQKRVLRSQHGSGPDAWGPGDIASRLRLKPADVKDILDELTDDGVIEYLPGDKNVRGQLATYRVVKPRFSLVGGTDLAASNDG